MVLIDPKEKAAKFPGAEHEAGDEHYRAYIDFPDNYDLLAAMQFNLLTGLGLRQYHYLLDIGCGSLRVGRLLIPYLLPGRYFGIEPQQWLIDRAFEHELGRDISEIKKPVFDNNDSYELNVFGVKFDYVVAQSIFTHAPSKDISLCFRRAYDVMKDESIFICNVAVGERNYSGNEWVYPEFVKYTAEHITELAEAAGLKSARLNWSEPPSGQSWFAVTKNDYENIEKLTDPYASSTERIKVEERLKACEKQLTRLYAVLGRIAGTGRDKDQEA